MNFERYLNTVSGNYRRAVKVEWLNPDESVAFEFTDSLYDINVDLSVNYQSGSRRACTLTLSNERNQFPVNFNNIWMGQKFKLWMGLYIDDETPYYFPQGVFYVSNPSETYQPSVKTIKINGVDKWAYLDGRLHGKLSGTYQSNIGNNLFQLTRDLLQFPNTPTTFDSISESNLTDYFTVGTRGGVWENGELHCENDATSGVWEFEFTAKYHMDLSFNYDWFMSQSSNRENVSEFRMEVGGIVVEDAKTDPTNNTGSKGTKKYSGVIHKGDSILIVLNKGYYNGDPYVDLSDIRISLMSPLDPQPPLLSSYYVGKMDTRTTLDPDTGEKIEVTEEILKCPYTAKVERGKSYADVLLEYANILCANIFYDVNGRLVIEPRIDTADDITDTNKEILWDYTVENKVFLGLSQTYNFDKIYNDIIILGNVVNGYQFRARVQNRNPMSDTCVQKIGLKTKTPIEDNQYYSDKQCQDLAIYHAKVDTILQKSGTIESTVLYHLDVNKLVSISTPNNDMSKELFLITGYSISTSSDVMSLNVISVNVLKDFTVVEAGV